MRPRNLLTARNFAALSAGLLMFWPGGNLSGQNGDVLRETLNNGLRVVVVRNRLAPVVTTVLNYQAGSNEAPEGFPGMAHAQEHMMFRGSPSLSAGQLAEIASRMGGEFNADTQQTVTQYFFTVPSEDLDVALHTEAVRMQGVLDTDQLWDRERGAIEQEVAQDLSNPQYVFYSRLLASVFKGTPYAHDALGTRPSFDKTTGAMLKKFYDAWYAPNNAILVVVGDVQPQQILTRVKSLFGGIPARNLPPRPDIRLQPVAPEIFGLDTDLPYGLAVMSFRMPGSDSPDFAAAEVLADVLSSQRSELYALVPAGKALSTGFSLNGLPKTGLGYAVAAFPKGEDGTSLQKQMRDVLAVYLKNGFPAELVEAAKRQELTAAELQKNSVSGLAMAWSQAIAIEGKNSPDDDLKAIERVTAADVTRVARQYLSLDNAVIAILTPQPSGQPVSSSPVGGRESLAPKEITSVALPQWAEKTLSRISVPASTLNPVVSTLPNGIKLIVQPEAVSHTVSVYGHVENNPDLEAPAGQEGVSDLLERLFSYGTVGLDRLSFQKALDDIGAEESAGAGFSLQVLAAHFDRGVELLADNELHPALPEQAFTTVQPQLAAAVKGQLDSPGYLTDRAFHKLLFPDRDPTLRQSTPATISASSIQDVRNYYQRVFRPDLTTIVVMGQITPGKAREVVQKYFGDWKASGPKPPTTLPPVPLNKPSFTVVPDTSRVQDIVILGEVLGLTRSNPDYYALELGNHVLGGGFYATRLYRDLRENGGLVYNVSSSFEVRKSRGLYVVRYACDPQKIFEARGIVERNLKDMQREPVTPQELRQAKAMLLREIPLSESSISRIAAGLISRTSEDLPLDEPTLAARRYLRLSAAEVKAAFVKWLRVKDLVQVTEGPAPKL
jgi:zinc protease